jgi:hypothetical protein
MQADRMRRAALIVLGRDHPDFVREFGGNGFEHGESGRVDTVVVRQQHSRHFGFVGGHRDKLLVLDKQMESSLSSYRRVAYRERRNRRNERAFVPNFYRLDDVYWLLLKLEKLICD